jgi:hypothetical protein
MLADVSTKAPRGCSHVVPDPARRKDEAHWLCALQPGLNTGDLADRGYRLKSEIHSSGIVSEDQALAGDTRATLALRNKSTFVAYA